MGYLFSLVNAAVFAISLYSRDSTQRFLMILVLNDALRTSIFRQNLGHHFIATFQLLSFQRRPNLSMSGVKKTKQMFLFRTSLFARGVISSLKRWTVETSPAVEQLNWAACFDKFAQTGTFTEATFYHQICHEKRQEINIFLIKLFYQ